MMHFNLIPRDPWAGVGWAWTRTLGFPALLCTVGPYALRIASAGRGRIIILVWVTR